MLPGRPLRLLLAAIALGALLACGGVAALLGSPHPPLDSALHRTGQLPAGGQRGDFSRPRTGGVGWTGRVPVVARARCSRPADRGAVVGRRRTDRSGGGRLGGAPAGAVLPAGSGRRPCRSRALVARWLAGRRRGLAAAGCGLAVARDLAGLARGRRLAPLVLAADRGDAGGGAPVPGLAQLRPPAAGQRPGGGCVRPAPPARPPPGRLAWAFISQRRRPVGGAIQRHRRERPVGPQQRPHQLGLLLGPVHGLVEVRATDRTARPARRPGRTSSLCGQAMMPYWSLSCRGSTRGGSNSDGGASSSSGSRLSPSSSSCAASPGTPSRSQQRGGHVQQADRVGDLRRLQPGHQHRQRHVHQGVVQEAAVVLGQPRRLAQALAVIAQQHDDGVVGQPALVQPLAAAGPGRCRPPSPSPGTCRGGCAAGARRWRPPPPAASDGIWSCSCTSK